MTLELWKGNEAIAEAAVRAGLQAYFGYPITPQTELLEYLSKRMPELGRAFVQAESELGAVNMVYGAASTGARVMTSTSSPGASLMMEGLSYIAGTEISCVMVDVMRGGPGLGNIAPSQGDYNQIVHGGGHGDYFPIVLAPSSVQESVDLTALAFDLRRNDRTITIILTDGNIGQMMEPVEMPPMQPIRTKTADWAVGGAKGRPRRILSSIYLSPPEEEEVNLRLLGRLQEIKKNEVRYKEYFLDDAEYAIVGFGSAGRVALSAVRAARAEGIKIGLFRPITLNPFPAKQLYELGKKVKGMLVVEMDSGMMLRDVQLATRFETPIEFYARLGGTTPMPEEVLSEIHHFVQEPLTILADPQEQWLQRGIAGK